MGRTRSWVGLGVVLVVLVGLAFGGVSWRAHLRLSDRPDEVLQALSETVGLPVEADAVQATWWPPGVVVHGVRIPDESPLGPGNLAHADEVRFVVQSLPLLSGNVVVQRVEVVSPVVRLVRGVDGTWNFSGGPSSEGDAGSADSADAARMRPVAVASDRTGSRPRFDVAELVIGRARVSLRDRAIPGVPEFEITSAEARLVRAEGGARLEFEGGALGGPAGNLRGTVQIPPDGRDIALSLTARSVPASRLPEVMQIARGGIPFGAVLDGVVSAEVSGRLPNQWPPGEADIGVVVDATEAAASMAGGYVRKSAGAPLLLALDLYAGADLLLLRRAAVESGSARVEVATADDEVEPADRQPAMRVTSSDLTAATLTQWVPVLAAIAPEGELSLQGTIAPVAGATVMNVRLSGTALAIRLGSEPAELGAAAVDFDMRPEGRFTAGVSLEDLRSDDLFAQRLTAALEGGAESPVTVRIDGARGGRENAELDRLAVECEVGADRAEVRRLDVAGLGGTLSARGDLARDEGDVLALRVAPQWDGVDLAGLLRLFGVDVDVQGLFTGQAALAARQSAEETFLETLTGAFDTTLENGSVADLNLARATVDNLGAVPGLRQAIERHASDEFPELLAKTSRIDTLSVGGTFGGGAAALSRIVLEAPDYSVDATGRVAFDGDVDLDGDLVLGEEATAKLVSVSALLAVLAAPGESLRIPVSIQGTYPELVSAPSPAFVSETVAGSVGAQEDGGAAGFLRRLLGGGDRPPESAEPAGSGE